MPFYKSHSCHGMWVNNDHSLTHACNKCSSMNLDILICSLMDYQMYTPTTWDSPYCPFSQSWLSLSISFFSSALCLSRPQPSAPLALPLPMGAVGINLDLQPQFISSFPLPLIPHGPAPYPRNSNCVNHIIHLAAVPNITVKYCQPKFTE